MWGSKQAAVMAHVVHPNDAEYELLKKRKVLAVHSPQSIQMQPAEAVAEAARLHTGVHAHLCEHRDEVRFCLETYRKRPVEVLLDLGMLALNLLTANNVALTEHDISLMRQSDVKVVHCPSSNLSNHGFSKTPRFLEEGISMGLGSDGASSSCQSLFDQMKFLRYGMTVYWVCLR